MSAAGLGSLRPLALDDLPMFFAYLQDQLSDNGVGGTALFMPISRSNPGIPPGKEAAFKAGIDTPVGQPGWRRGWIVIDAEGEIAAHVDLRARPEHDTAHRALLGMGVHRTRRQQGLGAMLVGEATAWARQQGFAWLDLDVLSDNHAARALYLRCGFTLVGELPDMFRVDGQALGQTFMTRRLAAP